MIEQLTIHSVEQKFAQDGTAQKTASGKNKYKVMVVGQEDRNFVAYGDWIKAEVGVTGSFETENKIFMGKEFTQIWEPKPQPAKPLAETFHETVAVKEKEKALEQRPQKTDEVVRGQIRTHISAAMIKAGKPYNNANVAEAELWVDYAQYGPDFETQPTPKEG